MITKIMITENFARCIAKISGDGNLYYRYVRYSNTCKVLREEFIKDMRKEFGDIKFTNGVGNSGTQFVQVHGKKIINKFLSYLPDYRSCSIVVPYEILKSPEKLKITYLRTFYDDEGSASLRINKKTNEWKRSVTLNSNSLLILKQIKSILLTLGIKSNKIIKTNANNVDDKSYCLCITGKQNLVQFKEKIGFKHPRKNKRLCLMILSYGNSFYRNKKGFLKIRNRLGLISYCYSKGGQLSKLPIQSIVQLGT